MQETNLRPTPETDAARKVVRAEDLGNEAVRVDFAERLERQRDEARERIAFLERAIAQQNQEIEQICGKALGYPWFKDDQKNFPGATEADGVCAGEHVAETIVAELANAYQKQINNKSL